MIRKLAGWVLFAALLGTVSAAGQWIGFGQSSGMDEDGGPFYTVDREGNVYFNSFDLTVGGLTIRHLAMWDGVRWHDTAAGIRGNSVYAMQFDNSNHLIAGGSFDTVDGMRMNNIARWDGTAWHPLGGGLDGGVIAVAVDGAGSVYAVMLITVSKPFLNAVVKLNGATWDTLGGYFNNLVTTLLFDTAGNLYAGGNFDSIGGSAAAGVARWDGSAWLPMGEGLLASGEKSIYVSDLRLSGGTIYASGEFYTAAPHSVHGLAKWDGSSWCSVGELQFMEVFDLEADRQGNLYVGGQVRGVDDSASFIVAKWSGNNWTRLGAPNEAPGILIVDHAGNVYGFRGPMGLTIWRDGAWKPAEGEDGFNGKVYAIAVDTATGGIYAGGSFTAAGGKPLNSIALWNGSSWQACADGLDGYVTALVCDGKGGVFAGARVQSRVMVLRFANGTWDTLGLLDRGNCYSLAFDAAGNLYAGGEFNSIGGVDAYCIARWNGTVWSALGAGISGTDVRAITFDRAGILYAGGNFEVAGSTVVHNIARWDGATWSALGEGIREDPHSFYPVNAVAVDGSGNLYVGGEFSRAGTVDAGNIARWDGTTWHALAEGVCAGGRVWALAFDRRGTLYAGGYFGCAGATPALSIAQWDGQRWSALGEGVYYISRYDTTFSPGSVDALACDGTTLHVGGNFEKAGGETSLNFAQYLIDGTAVRKPGPGALPKPRLSFDSRRMAARLHLESDTRVRVYIISLSGRVVQRTDANLSRGDHVVRIAHGALPRGVYVAQVKVGGESLRCRFVVEK